VRFSFYPLHTGPRVQRASGIPCSLIISRDNETQTSGVSAARTRTSICCLKFESEVGAVPFARAPLSSTHSRGAFARNLAGQARPMAS
jgi:hypothetical protein